MADNVRVIVGELARIGLSKRAIAGVLGNLQQESGYRPEADNGTNRGIAQWDSSRWGRFQQKARENGWGDTGSIAAQAKYLAWEIKSGTGGTSVNNLNRARDVKDAVDIFEAEFERSGRSEMSNRYAYARQYKGSSMVANATSGKGRDAKGDNSGGQKEFRWVENDTGHSYNPFGTPNSRYAAGHHTGNDISAPNGTPIQWAPPVDGVVISRNSSGSAYGNHMIIRDEKGREWLFAHMASEPLKVGKKVSQGDQIGKVGSTGTSTGAHLHLEQTVQGKGGWDYNSSRLKAPKLVFTSKAGYDGGDDIVLGKDGRTPKGYYGYIYNSGDYLDQPENAEIKAIVEKAKKQDWPESRLQAEIRRSDWAKQRSQAQRTFDTATPAEQMTQIRQAKALVRKNAAQLGVVLSKEDLMFEATRVARDGDNGDQLQFWLGSQYEYDPEDSQSGLSQTFQEDMQDLASEYGFTYSDDDLEKWTRLSLQTGVDASSFEDDMRDAAQLKFPQLRLDGKTLRDALTPWLSSAAEELGKSYQDFDLTDAKWTDVVNQEDGSMLSDQTWRTKIRTDDRYGWEGTERARQEYQTAAASIARLFGGYRFGG